MNMAAATAAFLQHLQLGGASAATHDNYRKNLKPFTAWLAENPETLFSN